jgi:hypothetical protein
MARQEKKMKRKGEKRELGREREKRQEETLKLCKEK